MIVTQNPLFVWFLCSFVEVLEVVFRWYALGADGKQGNGRGLTAPESPAGSLLFDLLLQCGWAIWAGCVFIMVMSTGLLRPKTFSRRSFISFGIFLLTVVLMIAGAQLEPAHHEAAVFVVGFVAAVGGSTNLLYLYYSTPPKARGHPLPCWIQVATYWAVVILTSLGDAPPDRNTTYVTLLFSQVIATLLLLGIGVARWLT